MIKVLENGVPLAAVVSVEFDARWLRYERKIRYFGKTPFNAAAFVVAARRAGHTITEDQARKLRDNFLAEWPEVALLFTKK